MDDGKSRHERYSGRTYSQYRLWKIENRKVACYYWDVFFLDLFDSFRSSFIGTRDDSLCTCDGFWSNDVWISADSIEVKRFQGGQIKNPVLF